MRERQIQFASFSRHYTEVLGLLTQPLVTTFLHRCHQKKNFLGKWRKLFAPTNPWKNPLHINWKCKSCLQITCARVSFKIAEMWEKSNVRLKIPEKCAFHFTEFQISLKKWNVNWFELHTLRMQAEQNTCNNLEYVNSFALFLC